MEFIKAKTLVSKTKNSHWFSTDYNMNIYRGCCHGGIYCDSRSDCYNISDFDTVRAKEDAIDIIRSDLRSKRSVGVIGTGSMSDPYNPFEKEYKLTRQALEVVSEYNFGIGIATKSPLVSRDVDILNEISKKAPAIVKITVTTSDDNLSKIIEPNVLPSSYRFKALGELAENNIFCGVLLMPVLPYITDTEENIVNIVRNTYKYGGKFVYAGFGVTMRDTQREYYYKVLDENFPNLKMKYIESYDNQYSCGTKHYKRLSKVFVDECEKYGILYKMSDIISAYKGKFEVEQLTFGI